MAPGIHRICYVGSAPEIGPPAWSPEGTPAPRAAEIERSLRHLSTLQQEIVERRYWRGHSLAAISRSLDLAPAQVRRELRRALFELRRRLTAPTLDTHDPRCRLCTHPERPAIDRLLRAHRASDTWRGYLRMLKARFHVTGLPAKALNAHLHNHIAPEEKRIDHNGKCPR